MAKLVYNSENKKYEIKPDSWSNGGVMINKETGKIMKVPASYTIMEGSEENCRKFIKNLHGK